MVAIPQQMLAQVQRVAVAEGPALLAAQACLV